MRDTKPTITTHPGSLSRGPAGVLETPRHEAAEDVWLAIEHYPTFNQPSETDERRLAEALWRLTERGHHHLSEAALKDLATVLRLTIKLAREDTE